MTVSVEDPSFLIEFVVVKRRFAANSALLTSGFNQTMFRPLKPKKSEGVYRRAGSQIHLARLGQKVLEFHRGPVRGD